MGTKNTAYHYAKTYGEDAWYRYLKLRFLIYLLMGVNSYVFSFQLKNFPEILWVSVISTAFLILNVYLLAIRPLVILKHIRGWHAQNSTK